MRWFIPIPLLLTGCVTAPTAEQRAAFVASVPTCSAARECEVKWAAARRWVLSHSGFKLQSVTTDFMETFNTGDVTSTDLWARVSKEPFGEQSYRILVEIGCNNMFGCVPDAFPAMQAFNNYVNAAALPK